MSDVLSIIKVAVGAMGLIILILLSLSFGGCRAAVEAEAKPPVVVEERVRVGTPAPQYTPYAGPVTYAPGYTATIEK